MKGRIEKLRVYRREPPQSVHHYEVFAPDQMVFASTFTHSLLAWDRPEALQLAEGPFIACPEADCDVCGEEVTR